MNPLTNVRNVAKLNEQDLRNGIFDHTKTWHTQYKDSAYIFIGGLPYDLTEGDILCVFSQYGEIVNINLVRDKKTGKSKGYGFICYEDQRSTILAVDNFNGIKLDGRTIRVDHVLEYRIPKSDEKGEDGKFKNKIEQGCAPKTPSPVQSDVDNNGLFLTDKSDKKKKKKKEKKKKKKKGKDVESGSEEEEMIRFREKIKERNEKDSSRRTDGRKETERKRYRSRSPSNDKINSKRGRKGHDSRSPLPDRRYERERSTSRDDKRKRGKREDSYSPERRRRRSRSPSPDRYRSSKDHSRRR